MITAHGLPIPQTLDDLCRPDRMALLVYDMQVGIVSQIADGARVTQAVARALGAARAGGFRVVFTRHLSMPTRLMGSFQHRQAMGWQHLSDPAQIRPWFLRDSEAFAIVPELAPREDEAVFDKLAFSAFEGTPLAMVLRDCGLLGFAIVGIATEIGIEPTVRQACDLGLLPVVVEEACGAGNQAAAERSLAGIRYMGDAIVTGLDALGAAMMPTRTDHT